MMKQRYENIDALRAIAALSVLVQHFFGDVVRTVSDPLAPLVPLFKASLESFDLGRFGVILFFLISGFVVPFSIRGTRPLSRFAISRFFRLYPALWLAVLLLSLIMLREGDAPSKATIFANLTMLPAFMGQPWLSGTYWTLSIELIFYSLCAFLYWRGVLFRPLMVGAFVLLLVASTVIPVLVRILADLHLPVQYIGLHVSFLFSGLLLRMVLVDKINWAGPAAIFVIATQFIALIAVGDFSLQRGDSFFMVGKMPIIYAYATAFALFIASVKIGKPKSEALSFIGAISYSTYLYHGLVGLLIYEFFPLTGDAKDLLIGFGCTVVTIMFSWLVYKYLETPMINFGRVLANRSPPQLVNSDS